MRPPTAQNLLSLFRSAATLTSRRSKTSSAAAKKKNPRSAADADSKESVSSIKSSSVEIAECLPKSFKKPPSQTASTDSTSSLFSLSSQSLDPSCRDDHGQMDLDWNDEYEEQGCILDLPCFSMIPNKAVSLPEKDERRKKWDFKNTQTNRFGGILQRCAKNLGPDGFIEVFAKFGKGAGLKECNSVLKICVKKARETEDKTVSLEQISEAYQILKLVKEYGFKIEEDTYGQLLLYLIDSGMEQEFFYCCELIKDENPDSLPRLAYYEMLLWIQVDDKVKIRELCHSVLADDAEDKSYLRECLLLALSRGDLREEFLMLLETLDITKVTSVASLECIFRSLGKFLLESYAERFLLALKESDTSDENISNFITEYAIGIQNLAVEGIILKFQTLHTKCEVLRPQYDKLIRHCCEFPKVHEAQNMGRRRVRS